MSRRFSKVHALISVLALGVAGYALWALSFRLTPPPLAESFAARPWVFRLHMLGGAVALALSPFQFGPFRPGRRRQAHRVVGRIYAGAVLLSGAAALLLAPFASGGLVARLGFGLLGAAWLGSTLLGLVAIRAGEVARHRAWMVRSFALCCAGISLRVVLPLLMLGTRGDWVTSYSLAAWLCWLPNLALAERYLQVRSGAALPGVRSEV